MDIDLKREFGFCVIPRGTLLYHGTNENVQGKSCMFFGLDFWLASVFHKTIQVWKVKREIEVIFLCEYVGWSSRTKSSIPRLYKNVFGEHEGELEDLDIKHRDHDRRNRFVAKLSEDFGINGWFSSMEENAELEVCLFGKQFITDNVDLIDVKMKEDTSYYKNSLRDIGVFPTKNFYDKSYSVLEWHYGSTDKDLYRAKHEKWRAMVIDELAESPEEVARQKERYFDLRMRLRI